MSEILTVISSAAGVSALASLISAIYVALKVKYSPKNTESQASLEGMQLNDLIETLEKLQKENSEMKSELILSRINEKIEFEKIANIEHILADLRQTQIKERDLLQNIQIEIERIESTSRESVRKLGESSKGAGV